MGSPQLGRRSEVLPVRYTDVRNNRPKGVWMTRRSRKSQAKGKISLPAAAGLCGLWFLIGVLAMYTYIQ